MEKLYLCDGLKECSLEQGSMCYRVCTDPLCACKHTSDVSHALNPGASNFRMDENGNQWEEES